MCVCLRVCWSYSVQSVLDKQKMQSAIPVLFQVVLTFEGLAADLAREGDVILVGPLVYHQVVRLGETALAILADEFAFGSHFSAKLPPFVTVYLHNREHLEPHDPIPIPLLTLNNKT